MQQILNRDLDLVSNVWVRVWVWFSMFAFGKIAVNELLEE
jgi:hypothetical protein